jgi:DNA mismatch repair protein MutL
MGFVGKPETAKKNRGDQYFFVNNRFIKSAYLNHAIMNAFEALIPKDSFPMYALFIDINPSFLDINVHPTKQEIKFEDEKIVYAFVQSAVKHSLAQFSITPTLDFELDPGIQQLDSVSQPLNPADQKNNIANSSLYQSFSRQHQAHVIDRNSDFKHWRDLYETPIDAKVPTDNANRNALIFNENPGQSVFTQLHAAYILFQTDDGFYVVHQQNAHERVLYERYSMAVEGKPMLTQQSLFPATIELTPSDAVLLTELLPDLHDLGYHIEPFGKHTFVIQGTPADIESGGEKPAIEKMLEQYKHFTSEIKYDNREKLIRSLAIQSAIKPGALLTQKEMQELIAELFACKQPNITAGGKPTFTSFKKSELDKIFGR